MGEISDGKDWFEAWDGRDGCMWFWMGSVMLDMGLELSGSTCLCRPVRKRKRIVAGLGGRRRRRRGGRRGQVVVEGLSSEVKMNGCHHYCKIHRI